MENRPISVAYGAFSENTWVYPDDSIELLKGKEIVLHCARGGNVLTQLLTDLTVHEGDQVSYSVNGANGVTVIPYQLVPVTVTKNSAPWGKPHTTDNYEEVKDFVTRKAPFDVYDATAPIENGLAYTGRLALALRFAPAATIFAGIQYITVTFYIGNAVLNIPVELHVHKAVIPNMEKSKLWVTNWIIPERIVEQAESDYYTDAYWEVYKNLLVHLVDIRNNHLSIARPRPHTPDEAVLDENGRVVDFDLSHLEKALQLAEKAGMTKLYGSYIAHWEEWDQTEIYLLWDWKNKCRVTSSEAYRQLQLYFTRVKEMVERNGWQDKYIQPLVDEPQFQNVVDYRVLCGVVRCIYPEIITHDPVEVYNLAGAANVLSIKQAIYEQYLEEFRSLQSTGQKMTYYACGCPAGPTMNRVIDLPLFVGRLSFWMCHRYNMEGYLHWGYHSDSCMSNTNHMDLMTPGNANIVYSVGKDFWESIRSHGQRAGAEDWELLSVIKENNPDLCQQLIASCCRSFDDYERNSEVFDQIHLEILELADKFF